METIGCIVAELDQEIFVSFYEGSKHRATSPSNITIIEFNRRIANEDASQTGIYAPFPKHIHRGSIRALAPFNRVDGRVAESRRGDAAHPTIRERARKGVEIGYFS
jgi:hypothetical protein